MTSRIEIACDGGSRGNPGPAAIGAVVRDLDVDPPVVLTTVSECIGEATNNVAEYKALIGGLEAAAAFGASSVRVRADSELLIRQLQGRYRVKNEGLRPLFVEAQALLAGYAEVELVHVRREFNTDADALVNAALDALG
jgi:ribonuclease HI